MLNVSETTDCMNIKLPFPLEANVLLVEPLIQTLFTSVNATLFLINVLWICKIQNVLFLLLLQLTASSLISESL